MDTDDKKWYVLGGIVPPNYVKQEVLAGPFETLGEAHAAVSQLRHDSPENLNSWITEKCPAHLQPGDFVDVPPEATKFMTTDYPELAELVKQRLKNPKLD